MNQNVIETKMLTKKHGSQYRVRDLELRVPQNCVCQAQPANAHTENA